MTKMANTNSALVIGTRVDVTDYSSACDLISDWSARGESRYVCCVNAHVATHAARHPSYRGAVNGSDLSTADGAPIAWAMRRIGFPRQRRVYGPDLMLRWCRRAQETGDPIFLYGATPSTLAALERNLVSRFPGLSVGGHIAPPFRPITPDEDAEHVERINESGARVVFVGLGAPKQEQWMFRHRGQVDAVMIGVGAAFDFLAGTRVEAPNWMQKRGLAWLHRLLREPRRLWRRYLVGNTMFVVLLARQLIRHTPQPPTDRMEP